MTQSDERLIRKYERQIDANKTNHILHLLLSIFTGGFWIIAWAIISLENSRKRSFAEKRIDSIYSPERIEDTVGYKIGRNIAKMAEKKPSTRKSNSGFTMSDELKASA